MKKVYQFLSSFVPANTNNDQNIVNENGKEHTIVSIEENKNSKIIQATFHPDAFFAAFIKVYEQPPWIIKKQRSFQLFLNKYSPKLAFQVTISPKLLDSGYVRVKSDKFIQSISKYIPICLSFGKLLPLIKQKDYLYLPITVSLPVIHQQQGIYDDVSTPIFMIIPSNPVLYKYKLTESFLWRYQYLRIRSFTSLKQDVIGEIPCDLPFQIIGYPVRAITNIPNIFNNDNHFVFKNTLNKRKQIITYNGWSHFEKSYWIKVDPHYIKKLPLMQKCMDDLKEYIDDNTMNNNAYGNIDWYKEYFKDKGYIIQQYSGHTVLECIGPLKITSDVRSIPILLGDDGQSISISPKAKRSIFDHLPTAMLSNILSFYDFEFIRRICRVSKEFYQASNQPSCYHAAIIPSLCLKTMLKRKSLSKLLTSLRKCKRVDIYSTLIIDDNDHNNNDLNNVASSSNKKLMKWNNLSNLYGKCCIEEFHLEFVKKYTLHTPLFNVFNFNSDSSLKILKLTQCNFVDITSLPNNLEILSLMNTQIAIKSWSNLTKLNTLIITQSANLHLNNNAFLQTIVDTLPHQILKSLSILDGEEHNKIVVKQLIENHNQTLNLFSIGGRICLYQPISEIFNGIDSKYYPSLEVISVSCLTTNEINSFIKDYGSQLRIFEMYCPFVLNNEQDIYQWLLDDDNNELFFGSLLKLDILMLQAFPHNIKTYMKNNKWKELRLKFKNMFKKYRNIGDNNKKEEKYNDDNLDAPLVLFDFSIDLNKVWEFRKPNIKQIIIDKHKSELNYGCGI